MDCINVTLYMKNYRVLNYWVLPELSTQRLKFEQVFSCVCTQPNAVSPGSDV